MIEVPLTGGAVQVRGAVWIEPTARGIRPRRFAPEAARRIVDDFMRASLTQSAGVRLAFRTAATRLVLRVHATKLAESADAPLPAAVYDLSAGGEVVATAESDDGSRFLFSFDEPVHGVVPGGDATLRFDLDGVERDYELWLPYTDEVELLGLSADAALAPPADGGRRRWVHHGSSISHGYLASRTTRTWPVIAAQSMGLELVNLAYSGNALLDQSTARTLRDTPGDVMSVKLGINIVNGDMMRLRVFRSAVHGFLDTIRDGHPDTPLLVVSPVSCPPVEDLPGPTIFDPTRTDKWVTTAGTREQLAEGKLSLAVIRRELAEIVAARRSEDPHIDHLDGSLLYSAADSERLPMPDNLHPGDDVNALIAARFAERAFRHERSPL
ncbi:SGNH/GDSL hydrolase family protein [Microbacterium cremeum]|uniref:SGNH/GDSL hydrolase family protein n=1 Tax=Microbacterium cremeum TaxID=2782169 RepID=UPI001886DF89|nr:SGNH/GDSL hydrolase family protein [Microbacterium cremeum]